MEQRLKERLSYLGIHPINSHQTPNLLWITRSAYQKEPVWVSFGVALPEPYRYRGKYWQPIIGLSTRFTMEELEDRLEGEVAPKWEEG